MRLPNRYKRREHASVIIHNDSLVLLPSKLGWIHDKVLYGKIQMDILIILWFFDQRNNDRERRRVQFPWWYLLQSIFNRLKVHHAAHLASEKWFEGIFEMHQWCNIMLYISMNIYLLIILINSALLTCPSPSASISLKASNAARLSSSQSIWVISYDQVS